MSGPYYEPERFGLTVIKSHDTAGSYEFDMVVVWRTDDGRYLIGHDSGCSCPTPFESTGIRDLTEVRTLADVASFARKVWDDRQYYGEDGPTQLDGSVVALLENLQLDASEGTR